MILFAWLGSEVVAAPAPDDPAEEIIVYGDNFARWENTRWMVSTQLVLPLGVIFATEQNRSFFTHAFQMRAVIACDKDARLSKKRWEVSCEIEDLGIVTTTSRQWRREKDRENVQAVLDEVDAKLTGMKVQMQVDEGGGITNFDLEGISADNDREREIQESLRQVISRTMAGFHLRIPDHGQRAGKWVEYRSELMDLPSLTSSRGSSMMVHQVNPFEGMQIVQTLGEGMVSVNLPNYSRELFPASPVQDSDDGSAPGDDPSSGAATGGSVGSGAETDIELTYKMHATGVAVFRKADGIMTERVWLVTGTPTAGSGGGTATAPYENAGRIQMLGENDMPDVGPSKQVAWPGRKMEGLDPWVSIEAIPTAGTPSGSTGPG